MPSWGPTIDIWRIPYLRFVDATSGGVAVEFKSRYPDLLLIFGFVSVAGVAESREAEQDNKRTKHGAHEYPHQRITDQR